MTFSHFRIHHKLYFLAGVIFILWLIGTVLIHHFERGQGWSYFDAFYFTVITTATIGFGDLTPISTAGKLLTMVYAIIFVPLFLTIMTYILEHRITTLAQEERKMQKRIGKILIQQEEILTKENTESIIRDESREEK